jgi:ABC-type glycerol-3-phosphate transport system substrate-binding protein
MDSKPPRAPALTVNRRGFLGLSAAAGASLLTTAACGAGGGGGSGSSQALSVLCESGGQAELQPVADLFKKQTGHQVNLVVLPYDGLFNRLSSELTSGAVSFDVAAVDAIWVPQFGGAAQSLDALFTDAVKADLFASLLDGAKHQGTYVGMPVWTNAEVLFYRKDLFEDATEQANFTARYGYPLAPPATWQQFTDVARFFTRTGLYGTDVKGAVETEWLAHVLQAGSPGVVLDDSGAVIIDNAQHLAALTFYADLATKDKVSPPGAAQVDWAAAQNLFNQGQTAMTRFWAHAYRQVPKDAKVYGKVGVAPMIAGTAGIAAIPGPWYLMVAKQTSHADLAKQFVKFCYDNNALSIDTTLGLAARPSAYQKYQDQPGYEAFKPLLTTLSAAKTKSRPATPKWQQIVDTVLVPMLQKAVVPGTDYPALLAKARTDVGALVK